MEHKNTIRIADLWDTPYVPLRDVTIRRAAVKPACVSRRSRRMSPPASQDAGLSEPARRLRPLGTASTPNHCQTNEASRKTYAHESNPQTDVNEFGTQCSAPNGARPPSHLALGPIIIDLNSGVTSTQRHASAKLCRYGDVCRTHDYPAPSLVSTARTVRNMIERS